MKRNKNERSITEEELLEQLDRMPRPRLSEEKQQEMLQHICTRAEQMTAARETATQVTVQQGDVVREQVEKAGRLSDEVRGGTVDAQDEAVAVGSGVRWVKRRKRWRNLSLVLAASVLVCLVYVVYGAPFGTPSDFTGEDLGEEEMVGKRIGESELNDQIGMDAPNGPSESDAANETSGQKESGAADVRDGSNGSNGSSGLSGNGKSDAGDAYKGGGHRDKQLQQEGGDSAKPGGREERSSDHKEGQQSATTDGREHKLSHVTPQEGMVVFQTAADGEKLVIDPNVKTDAVSRGALLLVKNASNGQLSDGQPDGDFSSATHTVYEVVALPGETVKIVNSKVLVDGEEIADFPNRELSVPNVRGNESGDATYEWRMAAEKFFVLQDRTHDGAHSGDHLAYGPISGAQIVGKVVGYCIDCAATEQQ
ncbi:S26 family signal peptidase [Numidum massiliense]|uniref:S26 family signal peptidase n=1 Tax=Numidum massiliense TaxID=1522315 RepID=UPI0006D5887A|nr:S26 family signal peptidase [Numidum massiliense]